MFAFYSVIFNFWDGEKKTRDNNSSEWITMSIVDKGEKSMHITVKGCIFWPVDPAYLIHKLKSYKVVEGNIDNVMLNSFLCPNTSGLPKIVGITMRT